MKFLLFFFVILQLIEIHCEEIEININVKLNGIEQSSNTSSSRIISVLIKHERNNVQSVYPNTTTTSQYNISTSWSTNSTDELSNTTAFPTWQTTLTNLWSNNNTTLSPIWELNSTNSWLIDGTNSSTDQPLNATNPWWLDWWLQIPTTFFTQ